MSGIRWHDRVFVVGGTGSGKSELLNYLFSGMSCQKMLLDTKPEFYIPDVAPVSRPGDIDWSAPVIQVDSVTSSPRLAPLRAEMILSSTTVPIFERFSGLMASELFQKSKPLALP